MELFRLLGTIAVDNSGAIDALKNTTEQAEDTGERMSQSTEKAESKMSKAFSKIGSAALKVGKVMATGIAVGTVAITALGKQALDSYADFEQLVGGVETLFKESAGIVQGYADNAYKTAGMSANAYMETVTSFSASLLQSLDGDTAEAAKKADKAITDMADNANKMGSSMESIQNAYQGFAKQNYTMLDNLKLGYGGTKEEMQRLLKDAQKISKIKYDIDSYADVVDAIHVIQTEMKISGISAQEAAELVASGVMTEAEAFERMGTTAKEASSTISGSLSSMKSAWKNLLTGLGNEDADLSGLIDNFVDSAGTVVDNVLPRVEVILGGIADAIAMIVPIIGEKLPELFESILPPLIEGAVALTNGLIAALPTLLEILLPQIPFIIEQIGLALIAVFPQLLGVCQNLFGQLWDYFSLNLLNTGVSFQDTMAFISDAFGVAWTVMQTLWNNLGKPIWDMISFAVDSLANLFAENMPAIQEFFQVAIAGIQDSWNNHLKPAFEAIGAFLNDVVKPAFEFVWKKVIEPLVKSVFKGIGALWLGILKPVFDGICDFLFNVFKGNWSNVFTMLKNIVSATFQSMISLVKNPLNVIIGFINGLISGITSGINSVINALNKLKIDVPDWVTDTTGIKSFGFNLKTLTAAQIPLLEKGGILEKGQIGLLEGNGAEAVVPLEKNREWIGRVSEDMQAQGIGGSNKETLSVLQEILAVLYGLKEDNANLPDTLVDAIANGLTFKLNDREFARLVKAV